jgi:hypothetical protein
VNERVELVRAEVVESGQRRADKPELVHVAGCHVERLLMPAPERDAVHILTYTSLVLFARTDRTCSPAVTAAVL